MKKLFPGLLLVLFRIPVTGQQMSNQDYNSKSSNQKTLGLVLTGGGAALVLGGFISYASEGTDSYFPGKAVGTILWVCGAAALTGGIVLLSASKRNAGKVNETGMIFKLKLENSESIQENQFARNFYPALAVHMGLK